MLKLLKLLIAAVVVAGLLFAGYVVLALNWSYSTGDRAGVLQKFSKRGWIFKTWEGELAMTTNPGVAPVIWPFSCRDEATAAALQRAVGRQVKLHYDEHVGIPVSWFGDTGYYVTQVEVEVP